MKFKELDERYLTKRKAFSDKYGPRELWSVIDQWPLYCGLANLGRFMAVADLLRSTLDVPGHVAEFGSWRGANLMFMTKLLRIFDPHGCKQVHCFESFEGLSTFCGRDNAATSQAGRYAAQEGGFDELQELMELLELSDDIVIHKGLIQDTLPPVLEGDEALTFSFVYCDTDLYDPTALVLDVLHNRLAKGGLFVFDEWNQERWPGEGVAANEFLKEHGSQYEMIHIRHARQPTLALRKLIF